MKKKKPQKAVTVRKGLTARATVYTCGPSTGQTWEGLWIGR